MREAAANLGVSCALGGKSLLVRHLYLVQITITLEQPNWSFTFDNDFARTLHGVLPQRRLQDYSSTVHLCACCRTLVDPVTKQRNPQARLSEIRVASRSCALCKLLIRTAERFHKNENENADLSVVRDGAALRLGRDGPRMLRLCSDVG
jgi:hypothetical protein